jgi:hypothetical protein
MPDDQHATNRMYLLYIAKYTGLALDNNNIILVFILLFEGVFSHGVFSTILYVSGLGLAALNVLQIKTPKLYGNSVNVYILPIYTIGTTSIYSWLLKPLRFVNLMHICRIALYNNFNMLIRTSPQVFEQF